jgi:hypothetical protein
MLLFNTHPLNRHPRSDVLNYAQTPSGARAEIGSIRPTACRKQDVKTHGSLRDDIASPFHWRVSTEFFCIKMGEFVRAVRPA